MDEADVAVFAMPLTNPSYARGLYRFVNCQYMIMSYHTDPRALAAVVPALLEFTEPIVK